MIYFLAEIVTSFIENYIFFSIVSLIHQKKGNLHIRLFLSTIVTGLVLYLNSYSFFSIFTLLFIPVIWGVSSSFF